MPELSRLPPIERVQRYIDLAEEARREAGRSNGVAENAYLIIAEQWERLATEAARQHAAEKSDAATNGQKGGGVSNGRHL